jgi:hypothetical protein
MANKDLKGRKWKIPLKYLKHLKSKLIDYKGDKHVEGYTRLRNLLKTGEITYENLKNIKHILEKNSKNETLYELNGGKIFHRWIDDQLKIARDRLDFSKKAKKNSGMDNAYKKPHEKDSSKNTTKIRTPKLHKSTSSNDIYNNNVNYETHKTIKLVISESLFDNIFGK